MTQYEKDFLQYCIIYFGGRAIVENDFVFLFIGKDQFRIHLKDRERFGVYSVYHLNSAKRLDGKNTYHIQTKAKNLDFAYFVAFCHEFNKSIGIKYELEDFFRFKKDSKKYSEYRRNQV